MLLMKFPAMGYRSTQIEYHHFQYPYSSESDKISGGDGSLGWQE